MFNRRLRKLLHRKSKPLDPHLKEVNKSPQSPESLLDEAVTSHDLPSYLPRSNPNFPLSFRGLARASHHSVSVLSTSPRDPRCSTTTELEHEQDEAEEEDGILRIRAPAPDSHLRDDEMEQEDLIAVPLETRPPFETHETSSTTSFDFFNLDNNHSRFTDRASSIVPIDDSMLNLSLGPSSRNSSIALPYQLYLPPTSRTAPSTHTIPLNYSSLSNLDIASLRPPFRPLDSYESIKSSLDLTPLLLYLERYSQRRSSVPDYVQPLVRQGQRDHGLSNFEDGELSGGTGHCESIGTLISA